MKYLKLIFKRSQYPNAIVFALLVSALLFFTPSYSQGPKLCGNPKIDREALQKAKKYETSPDNKPLATPILIRVYFHICRNDNGTNAAATEAQTQIEFNQLLLDYSSDNICFANMGLNYIDNTQINTTLNTDVNAEWLNTYRSPNCINIFYHANLYDSKGEIGGSAYDVPNTFCSISRGNIGAGHTLSHEVGHCFGMWHTFENVTGYEDIDGSNSSSAGDQITDTQADPYTYKGQSCFATTPDSCIYTGTCEDPKGESNFNPPYTNMMAYWWNHGCYFSLAFTLGQFVRINSYLSTDPGLQSCESANDAVVGPFDISSGYYMPSTINQLSTSGSVNISGTANVTFSGGTVLLERGFHGFPSTGGLVLVRGTSCSYISLNSIAKTNSEVSDKLKSITKKAGTALLAFPNPTSSIVNLVFDITHNETSIALQVYDINGHKVKEISLSNLLQGKQTVQLNLSSLPSGMYNISLQLSTGRLSTKVVLDK